MRANLLTASVVTVTVTLLFAAPAIALSSDTWVSGAGADTGTCPDSAPCATVGYAKTQTEAGGEVHLASPVFENSIVIQTPPYSIIGDGYAAFSSGAFGAAISVQVNVDVEVTLRGLIINHGGNVALAADRGIQFLSGHALHVEDCVIRNGEDGPGIEFIPSATSELYVSNCTISDEVASAGGGILIRPTGSAGAKVVIDNVHLESDRLGILVDGTATTGAILVTIRNSSISGSTAFGIGAFEAAGGVTNVTVEGSTSANNGSQGVIAFGSNAAVRLRDSTVSGNTVGLASIGGGQIISHGGNVLAGNGANGAFTGTLPPQ